MEVKTTDQHGIFTTFSACSTDPKTFVLDVRPQRQFARSHVALSYNIRLSANGQALLDYSKNQYDVRFSTDCWWGKPVIVLGEEALKKDHPVIKFLAEEKRCKTLKIFRQGFTVLEETLPHICTQSLKPNSARKYPSEILPGELYLGEWSHAQNTDRLSDINVRQVITVHNSPENLELPQNFKHLRIQLADVDTQNIAPYFNASYAFVEEGRAAGHATLVHCGAGVSRSATLAIAYLMRRFSWNATKARAHCVDCRSVVHPNDGFWRSLCALESQLGITDRSDINQGTVAWHGNDAAVAVAEDAAGKPVAVTYLTLKELKAEATAAEDAAAAQSAATAAAESGHREEDTDRRHARRQTDYEKRRHRSRSHSKERHRNGGDVRSRHGRDYDQSDSRQRDSRNDRDRDSHRDRERDSRKDRDRDSHRDRERDFRRGQPRDSNRGRDSHKDRDRDPHRDRDGESRPRQPLHSSSHNKESDHGRENLVESQPCQPGAVAPEPPPKRVVFEVHKDGKVAGHLRLQMEDANQRAVVGRVPSCDVHLEHLSVSRHHAALTTDAAGHLFLTDLGAAHGTNIDGTWMKPNVGRQLVKGNVVRFGASTRQYKVICLPADVIEEEKIFAATSATQSASTPARPTGVVREDSLKDLKRRSSAVAIKLEQ